MILLAATASPLVPPAERLRTIRLRGELGEVFGPTWRFARRATRSVGEIVNAIEANRRGFYQHLAKAHTRGVAYRILVGGREIGDAELSDPLGSTLEIEIIPVPLASKGGVFQVILGVVMVLVGAAIIIFSGGTATGLGIGLIVGGIGNIIGGVTQLLAQNPAFESRQQELGFAFSGGVNVLEPGSPVPVLYGERLVGGSAISFGLFAQGWGDQDQRARVVDLISEGPIAGFPRGALQDSLFNETAASAFRNAIVHLRHGSLDQPETDGWSHSERTTGVNLVMQSGVDITRDTLGEPISAIRFNFSILSLIHANTKKPRQDPTRLDWQILVNDLGGTWSTSRVLSVHDVITNRRNYSETVLVAGAGPWRVRVRKISADTGGSDTREMMFHSFVEIGATRFNYPGSAYVADEFSAAEFQGGLPSRAYRMRGRTVRIPSNYNPVTRSYTGPWDGTFAAQEAYTDNPVWCWLDLLTHPRYGLGQYVDLADVDVWSLYRAARYADAVDETTGQYVGVSDGRGGIEPRYRLNVHLRQRTEAWRLLVDLASTFGAMPLWIADSVAVMQDRPDEPIYEFNPTNVTDGLFHYTSTPLRARTNRVAVRWSDPDDNYGPAVTNVDYRPGIARYGLRMKEVTAPGVTSLSEAQRYGRFILLSERLNSEGVVFQTGLEGAPVYPGAIIRILDPGKGAERDAGRAVSFPSATQIELDREVTLAAGPTYEIDILQEDQREEFAALLNETQLTLVGPVAGNDYRAIKVWVDASGDSTPDFAREPTAWDPVLKKVTLTPLAGPAVSRNYRVEYPRGLHHATVTMPAGTYSTLLFSPALPAPLPAALAPFIVAQPNTRKRDYRVVGLAQRERNTFEITAIRYDPDKYAQIESGIVIDPAELNPLLPPTNPGAEIPPPVGLVGTVGIRFAEDGTLRPSILLRWGAPDAAAPGSLGIRGYAISYQALGSPLHAAGPVQGTSYEIENVAFGIYQIDVSTVLVDGRTSPSARVVVKVDSESIDLPPIRVTQLEIEKQGADTEFRGKDVRLVWQVAIEGLAVDPSGEVTFDAGGSEIDFPDDGTVPYLQDFEVHVIDPADGTLLRREYVAREQRGYVYTFEMNLDDGGPRRALRFAVAARDTVGRIGFDAGLFDEIDVTNLPPRLPANVNATVATASLWIDWDPFSPFAPGSDPDLVGFLIWVYTEAQRTAGFDVEAEEPASRLAQGPARIPLFADTTYYFRIAAYDAFSDDPAVLNVSAEFGPFVIPGVPATIADGAITTEKLADLAVTPAKVAVWLAGVSGPTFPGSPTDGQYFRLTAPDLGLPVGTYVWRDSQWIGVDGIHSDTQIDDALIGDAKIVSLSAGKINAGILSADRIGARTVGVEKLIVAGDWRNHLHDPGFEITKARIDAFIADPINNPPAALTDLYAVDPDGVSGGAWSIVAAEGGVTPWEGVAMARYAATGQTGAAALLGNAPGGTLVDDVGKIPAQQGDKRHVALRAITPAGGPGATAAVLRARIDFYDSGGSLLGQTLSPAVAVGTTYSLAATLDAGPPLPIGTALTFSGGATGTFEEDEGGRLQFVLVSGSPPGSAETVLGPPPVLEDDPPQTQWTTTEAAVQDWRRVWFEEAVAPPASRFSAAGVQIDAGAASGSVFYVDSLLETARVGRAIIESAAIGEAQIESLAVTTGKIKDLSVETIKIANQAVTKQVEYSVPTGYILDNRPETTPAVHLYDTWKTIAAGSIAALGGNVLVICYVPANVVHIDPDMTVRGPALPGDGRRVIAQTTPTIRFRVVRDLGLAGEAPVFESGPLSISTVGYWPLFSASRLDAVFPGVYTYDMQILHQRVAYNAGVATNPTPYAGGGPPSQFWQVPITGTGTIWSWVNAEYQDIEGTGEVAPAISPNPYFRFLTPTPTDWFYVLTAPGGVGSESDTEITLNVPKDVGLDVRTNEAYEIAVPTSNEIAVYADDGGILQLTGTWK